MSKVYLKDVVTRIKDKVDKDNTDLEYYIGGEHFDNGEIQITKKGRNRRKHHRPGFSHEICSRRRAFDVKKSASEKSRCG